MKLDRLRNYFRSNPGASFIVAFQVLLASAAVLFVFGNPSVTNEVAIYAFYALVVGVAIQIVLVIREERRRTRAGNDDRPSASGT